MKGIRIKAATPKGTTALSSHIKESMKFGIGTKAMMKTIGVSQEVTSDNPLTLEVRIHKKQLQALINPENMKNEIRPSLQERGAIDNKDYTMEVIE